MISSAVRTAAAGKIAGAAKAVSLSCIPIGSAIATLVGLPHLPEGAISKPACSCAIVCSARLLLTAARFLKAFERRVVKPQLRHLKPWRHLVYRDIRLVSPLGMPRQARVFKWCAGPGFPDASFDESLGS